MKPIIYTSRIATEAIGLERKLIQNKLKPKATILYLGEDFKHNEIPLSPDSWGKPGRFIPTMTHEDVVYGNTLEMIRVLDSIE